MEELQLPMDQALQTLDADALMRFQRLQTAAVSAVTERFYAVHSAAYERFGETGRDACRSDLAFHLEFLRPVLQFGMLKPMVADAFLLAGWDIQYLGANVPTSELVKQVIAWQPDLVGLSVSFPQQLKVIKDAIEQMKLQMGDQRPPIIVGGLAINRFQQLTGVLGADASSLDAQAAVDRKRSIDPILVGFPWLWHRVVSF